MSQHDDRRPRADGQQEGGRPAMISGVVLLLIAVLVVLLLVGIFVFA